MNEAKRIGAGLLVLAALGVSACGTGETCTGATSCKPDVSEDGDQEAERERSDDVRDCQAACQKFYDCDREAGLTNSPYNETWTTNCKASCAAADTIDAALASCIVTSTCADVTRCKPAAS